MSLHSIIDLFYFSTQLIQNTQLQSSIIGLLLNHEDEVFNFDLVLNTRQEHLFTRRNIHRSIYFTWKDWKKKNL